MRKKCCLLLLSISIATNVWAQEKKKTSLVNPFIGTDGFGHTFPGATTPFGMVQLSPDTRTTGWENCSGYHSSNTTILGFTHTHLSGTGAADYGDILFMPTCSLQLNEGDETQPMTGYRSAFHHDSERATPGYYRVRLDDYGIQVELTSTTRAGFQKYIYPATDSAYVIVDLVHGISDKVLGSELKIIDNHTIAGYRRSGGWAKDHVVYFYAVFSQDFLSSTFSEKTVDKNNIDGTNVKAAFRFKTAKNGAIYVKVGISTVSTENALLNLQNEIPAWDFQKTILDASNMWEKELSRISIEGGNHDQQTNFYTALYHAMTCPNIMSDVDGRFRGMDGKIQTMKQGNMYTVFSLWDTFRALHPLYTMIDSSRAQDFVRALLIKYQESGLLPVWELASNETGCMIGYHSVPVIYDAWHKGLHNFDPELAFQAMKKSAEEDKLGLKYYKSLGYIPADKENESVSKTLEYAYDDWCIAQMAKDLGKKEDYETFSKRSMNYQNVYDSETGFMRAKKNSNWFTPFDPYEVSGTYTEANAWQYTYFVPQDIKGMMVMMGGMKKFTEKLDTLFTTPARLTGRDQPDISGMIGQYAQGNEPSHHMAYLYCYTNESYKTADIVRKILSEFYQNKRDGLIGNEDCGQMSAWYVLSAMGLYPVCPGEDYYVYGSPIFQKTTIHFDNGKTFVIKSDSTSEKSKYINQAILNGKVTDKWITNQQIESGGTLEFKMSAQPSSKTFIAPDVRENKKVVMTPFLISGEKAFLDSCRIEMRCYSPGATIYYTIDGSDPGTASIKYSHPFYLHSTTTLKMKAILSGYDDSYADVANFIKLPYHRSITYVHPFNHLYTAGGMNGLLDGVHGEANSFGAWQGFYGDDFEAVVDLGDKRDFNHIRTSWLQQAAAWIWLPLEVEYEVSNNGTDYTKIYSDTTTTPDDTPGSFVKIFHASLNKTTARYLKIKAKNRGICPPWHPGAGEKAWIFIDEIEIE